MLIFFDSISVFKIAITSIILVLQWRVTLSSSKKVCSHVITTDSSFLSEVLDGSEHSLRSVSLEHKLSEVSNLFV